MNAADFGAVFPVSRETQERLAAFVALLTRWNMRINLVSRASMEVVWERHILDSAQLYPLADETDGTWVDLGSGGGLPGLVIAILTAEDRRFHVTMVEADERKCAFLQQAISTLDLPATIENDRVERLASATASVISARALAPLSQLLTMSQQFTVPETRLLFPKGRNLEAELTAAREAWHIDARVVESCSDPDGRILIVDHYRAKS